ncbi:ABC transporter permease [Allohahella marinimesophila]|uniref:FtsX-like permease family protein n=1 Tax=Allohahella marinimesophila TaxID=1054972 RepID=A0ABP7QA20_9GAMM
MLRASTGFTVVKTLLSHYRYHPWQSLFLMTGLVAGVALWAAVQLINAEAIASYETANRVSGASIAWRIQGSTSQGVPAEDYIDLRRAGFTSLFPVIEEQVRLENGGSLRIFASDLLALPGAGGARADAGDRWLDLIQPPYSMTLSAGAAKNLGAAEGEPLRLRSGQSLPPVTIDTSTPAGETAFMDIAAARTLFPQYAELDVFSYLATGALSETELNALAAALPTGLRLQRDTTVPDLKELTASLHQHLDALGLLAFVVGTFIVFSAQRFALIYRQQTFSVLLDLGVSFRWLMGAVLAETVVWSIAGTSIGLGVGYFIALTLLPEVAATLSNLYGASMPAQLLLRPDTIGVAWLLSLSGLILAVTVPVLSRIVGNKKVSRFRSTVPVDIVGLGLGLLMCITGGATLAQGLVDPTQGFLAIGLTLLGTALLLPAVLRRGLSFWSPAAIDPGRDGGGDRVRLFRRWLAAEASVQLPALRPAMMALLLSLSAAGGIELMVGSFRTALEDWLESRLSADIFIAPTQTSGPHIATDSIVTNLIASGLETGWLVAAHQRTGIETRWLNRPTQIRGFDVSAPDSKSLPLADGSLSNWLAYDAASRQPLPVLVNEQASYLRGLKPGDAIVVDNGSEAVHMRIEGIVHDYGNAEFALYLPAAAMQSAWPNAEGLGTSLWLNPERSDSEALATAALDQAGIPAAQWLLQNDLRTMSLNIFDRTFAVTAALNVLTLLIAGVALLAALLGLMSQRLPELALWRALGLSRIEIALLTMVPVIAMALLTWLLSIPLGIALAWALVNRLNIVSFGWSMPLELEWLPFVQLGLLSFGVVVGALALVQVRLGRQLSGAINQLGADT